MTHDVQAFVHKGPVPRSWTAGTISDVVHIAPRFSDSTKLSVWSPSARVGMCCHVVVSSAVTLLGIAKRGIAWWQLFYWREMTALITTLKVNNSETREPREVI